MDGKADTVNRPMSGVTKPINLVSDLYLRCSQIHFFVNICICECIFTGNGF